MEELIQPSESSGGQKKLTLSKGQNPEYSGTQDVHLPSGKVSGLASKSGGPVEVAIDAL